MILWGIMERTTGNIELYRANYYIDDGPEVTWLCVGISKKHAKANLYRDLILKYNPDPGDIHLRALEKVSIPGYHIKLEEIVS